MASLLTKLSPKDHDLLFGVQIATHFQPVCSVKTRSVVGLEALTRGIDASGETVPPLRLFEMAAQEELSSAFEVLCRRLAATTFSEKIGVNSTIMLFVNMNFSSPHGNDDVASMETICRRCGISPSSVVIEVLESAIENTDELIRRMSRFRERGFILALDDIGVGHSNLDRVAIVRPDILKVDRDLVRGIDSNHYKQGTFKSLVDLSRRIGALVVAEGIETQDEAMVALELGADMLQGFFICRPQAPDAMRLPEIEAIIHKLAGDFKSHMVETIISRKLQNHGYNVLINSILGELACASTEDFDNVLRRTTEKFPNIECVYLLDESGIQVTDTIFHAQRRSQRRCSLFRPTASGADHSLKDYYYLLLDAELQKYTTEPYVSFATGNICRTISTCFRDCESRRMHVLCIDVEST